MALTFEMNKRDTCESKHATSPAECSSQSKGPTETAEPPIMTSNITKLPVPMTTDLTNIKLRARGSAESFKSTAHVPTSSPKGTTTVARRHKVIDLSADAKTIVKVPKTRKTTAAALKSPPVRMENKMGPTRAGRKRNRKRRGNRYKRNQNGAPSVFDPIELRLSKKETRKRNHIKRNQHAALSVSDPIELRLGKNETGIASTNYSYVSLLFGRKVQRRNGCVVSLIENCTSLEAIETSFLSCCSITRFSHQFRLR
mmetsp:Transcript_7104/g.13066  ORF Transcript_7104/g.13066 Transcript_7104/m.13066 type:complete len:256 (-) Transcript_7104:1902-2669(-)